MGERLAAVLNEEIDAQATDDRPREAIIAEMGEAAGIEPGTVNQILNASIDCPPIERLEAFAAVLDIALEQLTDAGDEDGCGYSDEDGDRAACSCSGSSPQAGQARLELPSRMLRADGEVLQVATRQGDDAAARTIELSFSSEEPYERFFGVEILGHQRGEVRAEWIGSGRAPLLVDHQPGLDNQVGRIESVTIADGRGRARVRFGKSEKARAILERVNDGEITAVSVGYRVHAMRLESEGSDGVATYRVTDWEPLEVSLVAIPADRTVGVGRSDGGELVSIPIHGGGAMSTELTRAHQAQPAAATRPATKPGASDERTRISEILAIGDRFKMQDAAREAIDKGESVEAFRQKVLDRLGEGGQQVLTNTAMPGLSPRDLGRDFSLLRLVQAQVSGDWSRAGFEREVSQEIANRMNRGTNGAFVPSWALCTRATLTSSTAGQLVGTVHAGELFIQELKPRSAVISLGATTLRDLSKNVAIPRQTAGTTAEWVAEDTAATESTPTFDQVTLAPNQLAARVSMSRRMVVQSDPAIEELMRRDLMDGIATAVDKAAINGSGTGAEPTGILNTSGVAVVPMGTNGANITWANLVKFQTEIATDNADMGQLGYLTNSAVIGYLRSNEKVATTGKFMLEDDAERLAGRRFAESNNVPSNLTKGTGTDLSAMIYGNWADLLIGEFGAMEIIVDPYTNSDTGRVRITAHSFWDIAPRHAESFAIANDIVT